MSARACAVAGLLWLAACESAPPAAEPDAPATATVDLGATVRQLGADETADADAAVERLAALGDAAVPALVRALAVEPHAVRLGALEALAEIDTPRARAALVDAATQSADDELRATALLKLGATGDPSARAALEAGLAHPSAMVSRTAAVACGAICTSPAAVERMVAMGLGAFPENELGRLRGSLARLVTSRDPAVAAHARDVVRARTAAVLDDAAASPDARARAALLATEAGRTDLEPVLAAAVTTVESASLRAAAVQWLGRHGSAAAIPVLRAGLDDPRLRTAVAFALQAMVARDVPGARDALAALRPPGGAPGHEH